MRSALVFCAVTSAAVWLWAASYGDALPDPMPVHWGLAGRPDGWMGRDLALLLGPLMGFGVPALVAGLVAASGQRDAIEDSGVLGPLLAVLGVFGVGVQGIVVQAALHPADVLADRWLLVLVAAVVGLIGALLPRTPRNGLVGVRTPLTLSSDEVWAATHRVAAGTMIAGAVAGAVAALALPSPAHALVAIGAILVGSLAPVVWSERRFGRSPRRPG